MKSEVYVLVEGLFLKNEISMVIEHPDGKVYYEISKVHSLSYDSYLDAILKLKNKILILEKKEKEFVGQVEQILKKKFEERNPLSLIHIDNIDLPKEYLNKNEIPSFLDNRLSELSLGLGLIHSADIKPIYILFIKDGDEGFISGLITPGLTIEKYKEFMEKRDINDLMKNYFEKLAINPRKDERLLNILKLYKVSIGEEDIRLRVMFYWTILEMLTGYDKGKKLDKKLTNTLAPVFTHFFMKQNFRKFNKVFNYVKLHIHNIDEKRFREYYLMRNALVHNGKFKEKCDYNLASVEMREIVEKVIYRTLDGQKVLQ